MPLRPGDVRDVPAAGGEEVPDGEVSRLLVVVPQGQVIGVVGPGSRVHDRHRKVTAERPARIAGPAGDDDPVDPAAEQRAHVVLLADAVAAAVAEQYRYLAGAEGVLGAEHDRDGEP